MWSSVFFVAGEIKSNGPDPSFDSSMMNGLQAVDSWDACKYAFRELYIDKLTHSPASLPLTPLNTPGIDVRHVLSRRHFNSSPGTRTERRSWSETSHHLRQSHHGHRCHPPSLLQEL
jgi:hypothetical protein